jgi:P pilus assembly chaperone PapD
MPGESLNAYKALVFTRVGKALQVNNPTAYHVSFFRVSVGDQVINDAGMVAPKVHWPGRCRKVQVEPSVGKPSMIMAVLRRRPVRHSNS